MTFSYSLVSHKLVIIGIGIAAAVVVIAISGITLWCCCCRGKKARERKMRQEEAKYQADRDAITERHDASRADRQTKHEAIRMKYGLENK